MCTLENTTTPEILNMSITTRVFHFNPFYSSLGNHCCFPIHLFAFCRVLYKWRNTVCIFYLTSLKMIILRFIHVVVGMNNSFIFVAQLISLIWAYHSLFMYLSVDGCWIVFQFLAITNKDVLKINAQVFVVLFAF